MQKKDVLYAAVGAPVVATRKLRDRVQALKKRLAEERATYGQNLEGALEEWASEGEKLLSQLRDGKVVEELTSKMDIDQAKEQVGKLRDQLEEMLETWRQSFRPEPSEETTEVKAQPEQPAAETTAEKPAAKTTAKKPAAKTTAKKPATKTTATKTSAAKTTKSSTAAKTSSAKSSASKASKAS